MGTLSYKSLRERLNLSDLQAKKLQESMEADNPTKTLNLANYFMRGFGVEHLYPDFPAFQYVNMGETYATTLYYTNGRYYIGSWGDFVETHEPEIIY